MSAPNDTSVPRARRHAERLAEALGLTVQVSDPVPAAGRRKRVFMSVRIFRGDSCIGHTGGFSEAETWDEVWRNLRDETRYALPSHARTAALGANFARCELVRCREELEEARKALARAEERLEAAARTDAAALAAVHKAQAALPDDRARKVIVALYEVFG